MTGDALKEVLDDPEIHAIRVAALKVKAAEEPLDFELRFVMPRKEKLSSPVYNVPFIPLTPEQERCLIDDSTGGPRNDERVDLRPTVPIDTIGI